MSHRATPPEPPDRGHVRRVGRGGSLNLGASVVAATLGIALAAVVTNGFSKRQAGVYFTVTSLAVIAATVSRIGTPVGLVYWIARLRSLGRVGEISSLLRIAVTPVVIVSALIGIGFVVAAPAISDVLFDGSTRPVPLLRVVGILMPAIALSDVMMGATRGFGTMRTTAFVERIGRPTMQVLLMLAAVAMGSLLFASAAWALPYLVTTVVAAVWLHRLIRRSAVERTTRDPKLRREFWSFTWPRSITSVVQVALQRLDIILVSALVSPAEAALYGVATRFLVVGQLTNSALSQAAQPQLASLISRGDKVSANDLYRTTTGWVIIMNGPLYLVVAAFSPLLLGIFGEQYTQAWPVTVALCVAAFIGNSVGMVDVMLSMAGRTTWNLMNALLALTVQVGLDLLLIPRYGAFGAALGWGASILTANLVPLTQLAVVDGLHPFGRNSLWALGVVLGCVGLPVMVVVATVGQTWGGLLLALAISGALYAGAVALLRAPLHVDDLVAALRKRRVPPNE